jgi:hypothetical protein
MLVEMEWELWFSYCELIVALIAYTDTKSYLEHQQLRYKAEIKYYLLYTSFYYLYYIF